MFWGQGIRGGGVSAINCSYSSCSLALAVLRAASAACNVARRRILSQASLAARERSWRAAACACLSSLCIRCMGGVRYSMRHRFLRLRFV